MSIALMAQVWTRRMSHRDQAIMLAMADHANDDGGDCFPSAALVAWKTGYNERTVRRAWADLREAGALVVVAEAGRRKPTEYRIDLSVLPKKKPFRPDRMSAQAEVRDGSLPGQTAGRPDTGDTADLTPVSAEPSINHQGSTTDDSDGSTPGTAAQIPPDDKNGKSEEEPIRRDDLRPRQKKRDDQLMFESLCSFYRTTPEDVTEQMRGRFNAWIHAWRKDGIGPRELRYAFGIFAESFKFQHDGQASKGDVEVYLSRARTELREIANDNGSGVATAAS